MRNGLVCKFTVVLGLLSTASGYAASFDCKKATTPVEIMICKESNLSELDDVLSRDYENTMASNIGDEARVSLKKDQRKWITERNKCGNQECLKKSYLVRIDEVCDIPVISGLHAECIYSWQLKK